MNVTTWRKSTRSGQGANNCVELARGTDWTGVRDSKAPRETHLMFGGHEFNGFLAAIKTGRMDRKC